MKHIDNQKVLVTGGTGSWGNELVTQLLNMKPGPAQIRIYSRGEHKQVEMKARFNNPKLKFIIGDVRDKNILNFSMKGVDTVFHLAALKHVPVCEDNPWEAVLTNVYGTQNVIETAIDNKVKVVVDVSTDKAVDPYNLYGVAKACGEKLIINANKLSDSTQFVCIRGGNVIGTNGSVIPLFKKQILEDNQITVTDASMTRYLMSTKQAIHLIFQAIQKHTGGEIFVLNMPGTTVDIIAKSMIELFGNKKTKVKVIGARQGEKKHEVLISKNEAVFTEDTNDSFYTIHPSFKKVVIKKPFNLEEFSSLNTKQLSQTELINMLKKENWLFL
ncbi:MAG: polysaccharide biosynthesis protein [Patescibacteria group bacterium]